MKQKVPFADAADRASELLTALEPVCERILIGGFLCRQRSEVSDIELILILKRALITTLFDKQTRMDDSALDQRLSDVQFMLLKSDNTYKHSI